ncbi:hypothetical protein LWI29_025849 [Acer saccharum]|uniref:MATH domain-containing protein n=1 Tax=Acer saccharum TaxID=4024 RepID=A0AA39VZ00_ACESA|nr:hypothetical protein LWI29_025849 [Acer saccharum]
MPTPSLNMVSPFEKIFCVSPTYAKLRVFGCLCYPWIRPYNNHKLEPRSRACLFIGYSLSQSAYHCLDLGTDRIFVSRHVTFVESVFPYSTLHCQLPRSTNETQTSWLPDHPSLVSVPITHAHSGLALHEIPQSAAPPSSRATAPVSVTINEPAALSPSPDPSQTLSHPSHILVNSTTPTTLAAAPANSAAVPTNSAAAPAPSAAAPAQNPSHHMVTRKLWIYPTGDKKRNVKDHISFYLELVETTSLPAGWEVNVVSNFFIYNHLQNKYLSNTDVVQTRYHSMNTIFGITKFIDLNTFSDPENGYLIDDTCVFGMEVFVVKNSFKEECLSMMGEPIKYYHT